MKIVPAWQSFHAVHDGTFGWEEKVPAGQTAHVRSVIAAPSSLTHWPATHAVLPTQAVALAPSWSHVPVGQACFGVVPPGQ
jgi:hypothetical protein